MDPDSTEIKTKTSNTTATWIVPLVNWTTDTISKRTVSSFATVDYRRYRPKSSEASIKRRGRVNYPRSGAHKACGRAVFSSLIWKLVGWDLLTSYFLTVPRATFRVQVARQLSNIPTNRVLALFTEIVVVWKIQRFFLETLWVQAIIPNLGLLRVLLRKKKKWLIWYQLMISYRPCRHLALGCNWVLNYSKIWSLWFWLS